MPGFLPRHFFISDRRTESGCWFFSGKTAAPGTEPGTCDDSCNIVREGPTRTKGYWKNHPTVIDGSCDDCPDNLVDPSLAFCGMTIDSACDALKFLKKKSGGLNQFKSQGMAALLNCTAFDYCPEKIEDIIIDNTNACKDGDDAAANGKSWSRVAGKLDRFNNSNDDWALGFKSPSAMPKYYKKYCD